MLPIALAVGFVAGLGSLGSASPLHARDATCAEPASYPVGKDLDMGPIRWTLAQTPGNSCSLDAKRARAYLNSGIAEAMRHGCTERIPLPYNGRIPAELNDQVSVPINFQITQLTDHQEVWTPTNALKLAPTYGDLITVLGWMINNLKGEDDIPCLVGTINNPTAAVGAAPGTAVRVALGRFDLLSQDVNDNRNGLYAPLFQMNPHGEPAPRNPS